MATTNLLDFRDLPIPLAGISARILKIFSTQYDESSHIRIYLKRDISNKNQTVKSLKFDKIQNYPMLV